MVDILYNVMRRPIANEPSQKDVYHVDRAQKDAKTKRIEDDEPKQGAQQEADKEQAEDDKEQASKQELEQRLNQERKGKGLYEDESGKKHLDFYA